MKKRSEVSRFSLFTVSRGSNRLDRFAKEKKKEECITFGRSLGIG